MGPTDKGSDWLRSSNQREEPFMRATQDLFESELDVVVIQRSGARQLTQQGKNVYCVREKYISSFFVVAVVIHLHVSAHASILCNGICNFTNPLVSCLIVLSE